MPVVVLALAQELTTNQFGVVPVVAQAGTALAPLLAIAISNTVGLLMRPRKLAQELRAKPWILVILVGVGLAGWGLWRWWTATPVVAASPARSVIVSTTNSTDWPRVALELIRQDSMERRLATLPSELATVELAPTATASSPRYFRGDSARTGHGGGASPVGLTPAWDFYALDDHDAMVLSSPLQAGGRIYGANALLSPPVSYGAVFCLDAATGAEIWSTAYADAAKTKAFTGFFSSPAISADGNSLIIGGGLHTDYDSPLTCLDARSGAVRWQVATPVHIEGSPAIAGDLVVVGAGAIEDGATHKPTGDSAGHGHPGFVLGVRISTGSVIFRHPVIDPESSPVLKDGICYIGSGINGAQVIALRADRTDAELAAQHLDRVLWRIDTPFPATGAMTLAGGLLLVGCGTGDFVFAAKDPAGRVLALDPATGARRWSVDLPDAVLGAIAVRDATAIVPCRNGEVFALDLEHSGAIRWQTRVSKQGRPVLCGPAYTGSHVYAIASDGWLAVIDATDGRVLERIYVNAKGKPGELGLSFSSPWVQDGRLYIGSETGGLRCFKGVTP